MNQLQKARKEIAVNNIHETHPMQSYRGSNYRECTKSNPMPFGCQNTGRWQHPADMVHETDYDGDNYIEYICDACKHKWSVEMPD